jgi:TctA family transporter
MDTLLQAVRLVAATDVLLAILFSSIYGLAVGCMPGLSATMATALLVPVTFYLSPIAAIATIISASAMAIFAGDIPGCLLRIPGTPASAAYTDEAYAMTRKGQAELALGAGLWFSALGGIAGTLSLVVLAEPLAELALNFSTYEYFWLAFLGPDVRDPGGALLAREGDRGHAVGLLIACIGIENPAGVPRFTFGLTDLFGGIAVVPALVGVFACPRSCAGWSRPNSRPCRDGVSGSILAGPDRAHAKILAQMTRGNLVGIIIGVLPGRRRRHGRLGQLRHVEALLERAREVRHGSPRGPRRGRRQQQCEPGLGWVPSLLSASRATPSRPSRSECST